MVAGLLLLAPDALAQRTTPASVLAQGAGMVGTPSPAVRSVQRALVRRGYDLGRPGLDGRFGPLTARAVRRLQANAGIAVDGVVGPSTRKAIRSLQRGATGQRRRGAPTHRAAPKPAIVAPPRSAPAAPQESVAGWLLPAAGASAAVGAFCAGLLLLGLGSARRPRRRSGPPSDATASVDPVRAPVWTIAPSWLAPGEPVIGYVTVPPDAHRTKADAPGHVIDEACERVEWELVELVTDRETGRALQRPGLNYALEQIAAGKARGLVIGEVRRLTRSVRDLGALIEWFRDADAALVALDLGLDTSTLVGREAAARLVTLGGWEHEWIARRTQRGLAERPSGRPAVTDRPELVERITAMRDADMTMQGIADRLNAEGVPTLRGGAVWRPSSVQAALGYRRPRSGGARDQLPTIDRRHGA